MNLIIKSFHLSFFHYFVLQIVIFGGFSFYLYPYFIVHATDYSYWVLIIVWMILGILGAHLYSQVLAVVPNKNLFDIAKQQFGFAGGFLVTFPLLIYTLISPILMVRAHSEMFSMTMLPTTPQWFLNGIVVVAVFLATGGIISIVRAASVFFIVSIPLSLAMTIIGISDIRLVLGKPWFYIDGDFIWNKHFYASSYVWAGFIYFAIAGQFAAMPKKLWKPYALAAISFFPLLFGAVYLPLLTLGPELTKRLTFPYISKMDSVEHYWLVFQNLTSVFVVTSVLYIILAIALMIYCFVKGVCTMFPRWSEKMMYVVTGIFIYCFATLIPSWNWLVQAVVSDSPLRLYVMFLCPLAIIIKNSIKERKARHQ